MPDVPSCPTAFPERARSWLATRRWLVQVCAIQTTKAAADGGDVLPPMELAVQAVFESDNPMQAIAHRSELIGELLDWLTFGDGGEGSKGAGFNGLAGLLKYGSDTTKPPTPIVMGQRWATKALDVFEGTLPFATWMEEGLEILVSGNPWRHLVSHTCPCPGSPPDTAIEPLASRRTFVVPDTELPRSRRPPPRRLKFAAKP